MTAGLRKGWAALSAVLLLAVVLRLPLMAGGQIDYDEGTYLQSLRALADGHPLFASIYSSQPPGFLLLLLPAYVWLGSTAAAARIMVIALAIGGAAAAYRIGSRLASERAGVLAAAALLADPLFVRQSVTLQADGPCVALALVAVALAVEARAAERLAPLLAGAAGAVLALAVLTKLLSLAAVPALLVALALPSQGRRRLPLIAAAALGGALAGVALLMPFVPVWPQLWHQVVGYHLGARALPLGGVEGPTLLRELPLAGLAGAGLVVATRRAPALAAVSASWGGAGVLLLALQHPLWPHHAVLLIPPLALLTGGLGRVLSQRLLLALVGLFLGAAVASVLWVRTQEGPDPRAEVAALSLVTAPGDLVVTDDQFTAALAGRSTPPELVDTSMVRVRSGDLGSRQAEAVTARSQVRAVLLASGRLEALPGFQEWVAAMFPHRRPLGDQKELYWR